MELADFFPGFALKRAIAKKEIEDLKRYYDAATASNYRKKPRRSPNPQAVMQNGGETLRDYARDLDENHDIAIGILDTLVNNIVGTGIPINPIVKDNTGALASSVNEQLGRILKDWKRRPEASRTLPFDEMCRLVCRAWLRDGEILGQRIKGITSAIAHHGVVPYTLEIIEADYLPYDYTTRNPQIVQGVEVNNWSQPMAYHILKSNPQRYLKLTTKPDDVKRVEAERMFHVKFTRRINQIRGVTALHGIITRLDDLKDYEESERIAARVAAAWTGYIKKSPDTARAVVADDDKQRELEMSPGMIFDDLLPGEELGMIGSNRPNPELGNFRNSMLRAMSSGTGTNYSTISRDYQGSYSSQRQSMIESFPSYDKMRNYFIESFVRTIYNDFIEMALLTNAVKLPSTIDRATLFDVDIRGVAMPWIDPKKEVEADILSIENGLKSRPQVIRERGGNPAEVDEHLTADKFKAAAKAAPETKPTEATA